MMLVTQSLCWSNFPMLNGLSAYESGHQRDLIPTSVNNIDEAPIELVDSVDIGDKTKTCHQQQLNKLTK